eukprot:scaffold2257_cov169-Amphora_coffeaeformis.AAC.17
MCRSKRIVYGGVRSAKEEYERKRMMRMVGEVKNFRSTVSRRRFDDLPLNLEVSDEFPNGVELESQCGVKKAQRSGLLFGMVHLERDVHPED